ncbi:hypothetical protein [Streptomyces sp. NPDC088847]|uniref:hypothetical protein n=1 Tax=Streptomyces sp. NPDC088847 TaxID=3365909 RepID=UPI0038150C9A
MSDTTEPQTCRVQLEENQLAEIRDLVQRLRGQPDPEKVRGLLVEARTALVGLLDDRDDLVRANADAGAELARWRGEI